MGFDAETNETLCNHFPKDVNFNLASTGAEGFKLLKAAAIHILITIQDLPDMQGNELIFKAGKRFPDLRCILIVKPEFEVKTIELKDEMSVFKVSENPRDMEYLLRLVLNEIQNFRNESMLRNDFLECQSAFNSMSDVFTRADINGICQIISPSVYQLIGYTQEEVLGKNLADFYANPDERQLMVQSLLDRKETQNFHFDIVHKDRRKISVSSNTKVVFDEKGKPKWVEGNIRDITQQKKSREALLESNKLFRATFEQAAVGIAHVAPDGLFRRLNQKFCEIVGYQQDELLSMTLQDITHPEDLGKDIQNVQELLEGKFPHYQMEKRYFKKGGDIIWVSLTVSLVKNKNGEPDYFVSVIEDITQRKHTEHHLREREAMLSTLLNAPLSIILLIDLKGIVLNINEEGASRFDKKPAEIIGCDIFEFLPKNVARLRRQYANQVINTGKFVHFTDEHNGRYLDTSIYPILGDDGTSVVSLAVFSSDITDLKKAETEHDKLFNVSFDLLCIAGMDGYFKELNPAWENTTGYSREELYAQPFNEFIHPEDKEKTWYEIERLSKGEVTLDFENRYIKKSGEALVLSWTAIALPEENLIYCIARDITKRKQAENLAQEYQSRLKKLTFELTLSEEKVRKQIAVDLHDHVGQMLSSIRMQMSHIIDKEENPELVIRLKNISQALLKAIQATRAAIFDLSPPQLNEIGLSAAVHDWMKEQIEQNYPIKLRFRGEYDFFGLEENTRFLLFRSIKELVVNVVKHAKADNIFVQLKNNNDVLEITVEDDGIGFNYNPNLLKLKSNSYGLFSIQERISDLGGTMEVDSAIGKGTTITLLIPLKNQQT